MYLDDTIAAISTPPGVGGISIIRVSGKDSIPIVDKIFKSPKGKKLADVRSHTIHYGHIVHSDTMKIIDEVLISVMRQPHTFTREDMVEINCHGGILSTRSVLEQVLHSGARLANPGEFTKRAFLNGRIDLAQAEAIIDIIRSNTKLGLEYAVDQLEGTLSKHINNIRKRLVSLAAHLQAAVDFPEDDIDELSVDSLLNTLNSVLKDMENLIDTADMGKIIREGLSTVIIGKPNVGKSSLLNALARENRAIVTEIPGTTRDTIEEYINIKGVPLKIIDTAGIRETDDIVERIGVKRSMESVDRADLILFIIDNSEPLTEEDMNIFTYIKDKKVIILINKIDLKSRIDSSYINELFKDYPILFISLKEGIGLSQLEDTIADMFYQGRIGMKSDIIVTNVRHKDSLVKARQSVLNCIDSVKAGIPIDMIYIDIQNAIESLGEIIGLTVSEEIIEEIFRDFCIGK
ncbi:MAG: tRNA uridine-5-carboxymethylaminomethyl(34) synthesis GTPase MnmE [Clostridiaceae bacterium]|nr:tRNA uridine-5-carboxymethylaminomethyl(34) synthesis GTPase MnmE [Clostridiaceae bacterium]